MFSMKLLGGPNGNKWKGLLEPGWKQVKCYQQQAQLEEDLVCRLMQFPWVDKDIVSSLELLIIFSMRTLQKEMKIPEQLDRAKGDMADTVLSPDDIL